MKRRIISGSNTTMAHVKPKVRELLNGLDIESIMAELISEAQNVGYDMYAEDIDDICDLDVIAKDTSDYDFLPKLTVRTIIFDGNKVAFDVDAAFPTITSSQMTFSDTLSHWVNKWIAVAKFIEHLDSFVVDPSKYID